MSVLLKYNQRIPKTGGIKMNNSHIYDMIIIGGGPAGFTAAIYGARAGLDVLVLERATIGGQMSISGRIENYPGYGEGIDGFSLASKIQEDAHRFGASTEYTSVHSVELSGRIKRVYTDDGEKLCRTLLIATGADPRTLGLEGEERLNGAGVHYCAHCDGRFYKDGVVAVVGGGNSAVSSALYLSGIAKKVYLIHRSEFRADRILMDALEKRSNVRLIKGATVEELIADDRLRGVKLAGAKDVTELSVDALFVSIGRIPATGFLNGALATEGGYIVADESTRTSVEGVFAVGDVRTKQLRQIVTAVADGAVAAENARGYISLLVTKSLK